MIYTNENWKPPVTYCEPNKVEVQRMNKEEAIEILRDIYQFLRTQYTHRYKQKEAIDLAIESLQAEPKHGKWRVDEAECIYGKKYIITCSECGESVSVTEAALPHEKHCRNCGAKMDKGEEA